MLTPLLPIFDVKAGLALVYICQQVRIMQKSTLTDKMQIVGIGDTSQDYLRAEQNQSSVLLQ